MCITYAGKCTGLKIIGDFSDSNSAFILWRTSQYKQIKRRSESDRGISVRLKSANILKKKGEQNISYNKTYLYNFSMYFPISTPCKPCIIWKRWSRCQLFAIKTRRVEMANRTRHMSNKTNTFVFDMQSTNRHA